MKLVDTKDLKSLPFWECQFESGRGHQRILFNAAKNVLFVFKDRKSLTLNNDFWSRKFRNKYKVTQFFINILYLSNKGITEINKIISSNNIEVVLLEGDHAHIIDYDFIKAIDNKVKEEIFR